MKAAYGAVAHGWSPNRATCAPMPWVAELVGAHPAMRYERRFLPRRYDHQGARDGVSTTVTCWWTLETGRVYQARFLTAAGRRGRWATRYLAVSDDGDLIDMTRGEVDQWLSACSASTS